jgi:hypothetical protein
VCSYDGDTTYAASKAPTLKITVTAPATLTALTISPNPAVQFDSVCMIATPTAVGSGSARPTTNENVNFKNGTTLLATATIDSSGIAKFCTGTIPTNPTTLAPGTYSITAEYTPAPGANLTGSTSAPVSLTVTTATPGFTMSFGTPSLTVKNGGQAGTVITITPVAFPKATITFSCSNLPAYAWCTFVPNGMIFTDNVINSVTQAMNGRAQEGGETPQLFIGFTVTTGTASVAGAREPGGLRQTLMALALLCPGLVLGGAGLLTGTRKRKSLRSKLLFLLAVTLVGAMIAGGLIGCGGSMHKVDPITPTGTATIQINAVMTDGATASQTVSYQVVVQ